MQLHHSIFGHSLKLFALIGHSPWLPKTPQASHQSFSFEHLGERVTYKKYRRPHSLHQPTSLPLCRGQWFSPLFTLLNVCASSSTLSAIISSFSARSRVTFGQRQRLLIICELLAATRSCFISCRNIIRDVFWIRIWRLRLDQQQSTADWIWRIWIKYEYW